MKRWTSIPFLFLISFLADELVCDSSGGIGLNEPQYTPPLIQHIIDNEFGAAYDIISLGDSPNVSEKPSGWTPLIYAASSGNVELAEALILAGAKVNMGCVDGWTPLMFASVHGKTSIMKLLLEHGSNIHQVSKNGATALGCAKLGGFPAAIDLIDEALRDERRHEIFCDKTGREAVILSAAHSGEEAVVERLLLNGHSPNTVSAGGWTPLMLAAAAGCVPCMRLLLEAGALVDFRDNDGWTALMFCAHSGDIAGARLLVSFVADVLLMNSDGFNALQLARAEGHDEVFHTMVDGSFCREMATSSVSRMMEMVADGVGVNYACASVGKYTPLIVAVKAQDEAAVRALLADPSIDVDAVEQDHWSPLMFAALRQSAVIIKLLLQHGADRELLTAQGYSVIRLAQMHNFDNEEVLGMLENGLEFTDSPSSYAAGGDEEEADEEESRNKDVIDRINHIEQNRKASTGAIKNSDDVGESGKQGWTSLWSDLKRGSSRAGEEGVRHYSPPAPAKPPQQGLQAALGRALGWW